ncbi:MAG: formylglycine-generating enzyme family protein, partial [Deferribacteraceae bacterium]|nr:formylglycine-generating enzyme family protein [Deferribacteraceae bacterium]
MKKLLTLTSIMLLFTSAHADNIRIPSIYSMFYGVSSLHEPQIEVADLPMPANMVRIEGDKTFYIGRYEVTQEEWFDVMESNPSHFKGSNLPVESISWLEAVEYCNKRSVKEGLTQVYSGKNDNITFDQNANGYRLPTEAEWQHAAGGG